MKLADFVSALIRCSEKAANIARLVRSEKALFDLLVEEKTGDSKNKRFVQDFKTLADVLVQETIKHDLDKEFVGIGKHIYGEESNEFTNTLGETIYIGVQRSQEETAQLLAKVLDGNKKAATLLAEAVHQAVCLETDSKLKDVETEVSVDDFGVWIDPIDSTAQYIHGYDGVQAEGGVYREGLQCVVVLIGAYFLKSGLPVAGVINQPFAAQAEKSQQWNGRCLWGLSYYDVVLNSIPPAPGRESRCTDVAKCLVMSTGESEAVQSQLKSAFHLTYAAGAGYKIMCAVDGLVGAYVLSQGTTFKWDTCGPQAILRSVNGYMANYKQAVDVFKKNQHKSEEQVCALLEDCALKYDKPDNEQLSGGQKWSNSGGIIAFRDTKVLLEILQKLI